MRVIVLTSSKQDDLQLDLIRLTDLITDVDNSNLYRDKTGLAAEEAYKSILTLSKVIGGPEVLVSMWDRIIGRMRKRHGKKNL